MLFWCKRAEEFNCFNTTCFAPAYNYVIVSTNSLSVCKTTGSNNIRLPEHTYYSVQLQKIESTALSFLDDRLEHTEMNKGLDNKLLNEGPNLKFENSFCPGMEISQAQKGLFKAHRLPYNWCSRIRIHISAIKQ